MKKCRDSSLTRFSRFSAGGTVTARPDFRNLFEYDQLDRLKSIQQTALGEAGSNVVAPKFVDFSYNLLGQLTALSRFEGTGATGPALRTSWSYDGANRLSALRHESTNGTAATLLNQYRYTYDLLNRITGITSTLDGASTFTYDRSSQLRGAAHPAPRVGGVETRSVNYPCAPGVLARLTANGQQRLPIREFFRRHPLRQSRSFLGGLRIGCCDPATPSRQPREHPFKSHSLTTAEQKPSVIHCPTGHLPPPRPLLSPIPLPFWRRSVACLLSIRYYSPD